MLTQRWLFGITRVALIATWVAWPLPRPAAAEVLPPPAGPQERGDLATPDQFTNGQAQDQQLLDHMASAMGAQPPAAGVLTLQKPIYGVNKNTGHFVAAIKVSNTSDTAVPANVVISLTPAGTTTSTEFSYLVNVRGGGGWFLLGASKARLAANGIGPGRYLVSFALYDRQGQKIGESFAGNALTIGTVQPSVGAPPVYTRQLGVGEDFRATWNVANAGTAPDRVTLTTVITKARSTNPNDSKEFSQTVLVPGGGAAPSTVITAAQLQAAGIGAGDYGVTFVAFDGAGTKIGEFFGNPLTIGASEPTFTAVPAYSASIAPTDHFEASWQLGNTGAATATVTLLTVFTQVGSTTSHELYRTAEIPPGGGAVSWVLTPAERQAAGIGPGDYSVAFVAFDAAERRLGQFFGNRLAIGAVSPTLSAAPAYARTIGTSADLPMSWTFGNPGPTTTSVTMLTVLTPVGTTNSKEFYQRGNVPPGGGPIAWVLTADQRRAQGLGSGDYLVSFVAFDAADRRIGQFFGNPLSIGGSAPSFTQAPAYTPRIAPADPVTITYAVGNTGDAPASVTLTTVITPVGSTSSQEFSQQVQVGPGGGVFQQTITREQLAAKGIGPGQYQATFLVLDSAGQRVGAGFFGQPLEIGTMRLAFSEVPTYTTEVARANDFVANFPIQNTGDTAATPVTLTVVFTPAGTTNSIEATKTITVAPGDGPQEIRLTAAQRDALRIGPGRYNVTFVAFDPYGRRIGSAFFGALVEILP